MDNPSLSQRLKTARSVVNLKQGRTDWYRIKNQADADVAEVWIYDEIGYWGVTASDFVKELQTVDVDNIELHINSPGGDVFDGIAIYNALMNHKAKVTSYIDGLAASAASFIAMAGQEVIIARNATMMIHDAHGLCIGNAADMAEMANLLNKSSDNIADIYAQKSGNDVGIWRDAMRAETWYSSVEAVEAGLADKVGSKNSDKEGVDDSWDLTIFAHTGRRSAPAPTVTAKRSVLPAQAAFEFDPDIFRNAMKEAAK